MTTANTQTQTLSYANSTLRGAAALDRIAREVREGSSDEERVEVTGLLYVAEDRAVAPYLTYTTTREHGCPDVVTYIGAAVSCTLEEALKWAAKEGVSVDVAPDFVPTQTPRRLRDAPVLPPTDGSAQALRNACAKEAQASFKDNTQALRAVAARAAECFLLRDASCIQLSRDGQGIAVVVPDELREGVYKIAYSALFAAAQRLGFRALRLRGATLID